MAQQQVAKQKQQVKQEVEVDEAPAAVETTDVTDTLGSIDDVLDDQLDAELLAAMDDILEEDAEGFVANFVQEGGQ